MYNLWAGDLGSSLRILATVAVPPSGRCLDSLAFARVSRPGCSIPRILWADIYMICCLAGSKAAQRLTEEGFRVTAWNRDSSKAEALKKAGVDSIENLTDAVGEADVALLLLADAGAIDSVLI